jgi:hypothetical protein
MDVEALKAMARENVLDFDVSALPCGLLAQFFYSLLACAKEEAK